jgi:hypothetical protein
MKSKLILLLLISSIVLGLSCLSKAQSEQIYWSDDFNYASTSNMQSAGWTLYRTPSGISVSSGALTLDGKDGDAIVYFHNHFDSGIYDWKVETKTMWLGEGHTTNGVYILTEKHSYGFNADGYYKEFAFYRDNKKILHFGTFQESAKQWMTIALVRQGNTISMYYNGELKNTYQEEDTANSQVLGVDIGSPWQGNAKYDYIMLGAPNAVMQITSPLESTSNFPTTWALIGGGLAALVIGGITVYYFFIAGGHAGLSTLLAEQLDNVTQAQCILQDINQEIHSENPNISIDDNGLNVGTGKIHSGFHIELPQNALEDALSLGEQITHQGTIQNSIEQNSYQQYLENTTNTLEMLSNILQHQHSSNISNISHMDGGGDSSW